MGSEIFVVGFLSCSESLRGQGRLGEGCRGLGTALDSDQRVLVTQREGKVSAGLFGAECWGLEEPGEAVGEKMGQALFLVVPSACVRGRRRTIRLSDVEDVWRERDSWSQREIFCTESLLCATSCSAL